MTWRWVIGGAVALVEEFAAADLDNVFIDAQGGRSIDTSGMAPWGWIVSGVERIQSLKATGASAPVWVIERGSNKRWADWFVDPVHTNHIGSHALARCVARATHLVHDRVWPTAATTTTSTLTPAPRRRAVSTIAAPPPRRPRVGGTPPATSPPAA
jgi:hypothetical protein